MNNSLNKKELLHDDDNNDIKDFIRTRLDNFDKINEKYFNLIGNKNVKIESNEGIISITFLDNENNKIYSNRATVLGIFDTETRTWLWSWVTPNFTSEETKDARSILKYSLGLEPNSNSTIHFYIKSHLVNSRIYFDTKTTLDIHLALCLYISKKRKFIYPRIKIDNNGKKVIVYYLVY